MRVYLMIPKWFEIAICSAMGKKYVTILKARNLLLLEWVSLKKERRVV